MRRIIGFETESPVKTEIVAPRYLPDAGEAGFGFDDIDVICAHVGFFFEHVGAIADEGHMAGENVEDLGEFVDRVATDEMSSASDARIIGEFVVFTVLGKMARVGE